MRVGILTLPLHDNYGGILQAAALYRHLRSLDHEPVLLSKKFFRPAHERVLGQVLRAIPGHDVRNVRTIERQRARHYAFIDRFLPERSAALYSTADIARYAARQALDAIIVGSDQVWRPDYVSDEDTAVFFLAFGSGFRKISYAASLGRSEWTRPERIPEVRRMLADFDHVSLRETSAVELARTVLGREDSRLALDPTLLVDPGLFQEAMAPGNGSSGYTLNYVLDNSPTVRSVAAEVVRRAVDAREVRTITLDDGAATVDIPTWLRAFHDASTVVTDSFHGTIFSILFRKPFVCIGNAQRGVDRFTSLLGLLDLSERLVTDESGGAAVHDPIDFDRVHARLADLRADSDAFLSEALRTRPRTG